MVGGDVRQTGSAAAPSEIGGRRAELVRAAFRLLAESGLEGLRLRQVAEAVGIDHSTLHHHFATKQDLINAVTEYTTRQFWSTMPETTDPAAQLRGHLNALRTLIGERPDLFLATAELDLRARRDPTVRASLRRFEDGWRESLRDLIARGATTGSWSPGVDGDAAVELIIAVVKGARFAPESAGAAFDQLERVLTEHGSEGGT